MARLAGRRGVPDGFGGAHPAGRAPPSDLIASRRLANRDLGSQDQSDSDTGGRPRGDVIDHRGDGPSRRVVHPRPVGAVDVDCHQDAEAEYVKYQAYIESSLKEEG